MFDDDLDVYVTLDLDDRSDALPLNFAQYAPVGDTYGYDYAASWAGDYAGAGAPAVFSFQATQGAVYSVFSQSYGDPENLIVYDANGVAIAVDDGYGDYGVDHAVFVAPYTGVYYVDADWAYGAYPGQQGATLSILEDRGTLAMYVIDGTNRSDVIDGTDQDDDLYGHAGNDSLFGGIGDDYLDGGAGIDSAYYNGHRADYAVHYLSDRIQVSALATNEDIDMLSNVERLDFADVSVGLDIEGPSGQAYRLYQAAFDRAPDLGGLGYWIAQLDHGASLRSVAAGFTESPEFRSLYGTSIDHRDLVLELYNNVLHRAPDQSGFDYWVHVLDARLGSMADVLVAFSESAENHAQLVGATSNGIEYLPYA